MSFVVGAESANSIAFVGLDVKTDQLGVTNGAVDTSGNAGLALTAISSALDSLATAFASVGATQSRVDSALNQAQIALENTAAAESVIRDADFAAEFTALTKAQILSQTGVSVLAQSNARAQSVLALLQ